MVRLVKWLLGIGAALVLLVVVAVFLVAWLFDPEDYREEIEQALSDSAGRAVTIGGEMSLSLFPWLAVRTGDIEVANATAFGPEPMLSLARVEASIRLLPLFTGRVEIGDVLVDGLALQLAERGDGMTNWDDLVDGDGAEPGSEVGSRGDMQASLRIATLQVRDASIRYSNVSTGAEYRLSDFNAEFRDFSFDTATPVAAAFSFALEPEAIRGTVDIDFTLQPGLPDAAEITDLLLDGTVTMPSLDGEQRVRFEASRITSVQQENSLRLTDGRFALGDIEGRIELSGSGPSTPLELRGSLALEPFSPKAAAAMLSAPIETSDPSALARASLEAALEITFEAVQLADVVVKVDETTLTGQLAYDRVAKPSIRASLRGDRMDLDRYLPPADPDDPAADAGDNVAATALPVDLIRSLSARASLEFETLTLGGLPFNGLELGVGVDDQKARLNPIRATVLGGQYQGDVRIDASGRVPRLALDERVQGVDLGELARILWERDNIEGRLEGSFALAGRGETLADIRESLDGDVALALTDGALVGTDLWYQIRRARAQFKREPLPPAPAEPRTAFTSVQATAVVKDGVARNDDLFAELPFLQLSGSGNIDLAQATLDYSLRARVLEKPDFLTGASEAELNEYTEAVIPLKLTGDVAAPTVRPDIEGMARAAAEQKIEAEKDRLKRRLLDRLIGDDEAGAEEDEDTSLEDEAKKRLKDIFDG